MLRAPDLRSSLIAAALGATALWWQLRTLRSLAGHLDVMALNLLLTLAACGARHGVHGVFVHLLETAKDLGAPCWVCLQGPHKTFRALCEDLFLALCLWSNYMFAWPVFLVVDYIWRPLSLLRSLFSLFILVCGGPSGPQQISFCVCVPAAFIASHFVHQLLQSAVMHRYFSHRAFDTSRVATFLLGACACATYSHGPLWWASTHRRHHKHCETARDPHSPVLGGFWYSHMFWLVDRDNFRIRKEYVADWLSRHPELLILDLAFKEVGSMFERGIRELLILAAGHNILLAAALVQAYELGRHTSTHVTLSINSLCHEWKPREHNELAERGKVCQARDVRTLGILSCGESYGHIRHHESPRTARQAPPGEVDLSYNAICLSKRLGLASRIIS